MNHDFKWTKSEKTCARKAFNRAYQREMTEIIEKARRILDDSTDTRTIWHLHDFLTEKRDETDAKYDYRYSVLISVFGRLLAEGYLDLEDFKGLHEDKICRIQDIAELYEQNR